MTEPLTDEVVDACYLALIDELDRWEFIPQPLADGTWVVRLRRELQQDETSEEDRQLQYFTEKQYAIAFMQWQGLRAALTHFRDQALAPVASPAASPDTEGSTPNA